MSRRGGLGRGLSALIAPEPPDVGDQEGAPPSAGRGFASGAGPAASERGGVRVGSYGEIPTHEIRPNPQQPRRDFDEAAAEELAASVREVGVLQPVVVRPVADGYELVMGERRWRAAQAAGLTTIPAIVRDTPDDALLRDALLENIQRQQLNPLEEAAAYRQLLDDFAATHEELARRLGRSRPQVSNTLRLLTLPASVQRRVAAGVLTAGHARALVAVDDAGWQEELATRVVAEGLSVRALEEVVALGRRPEAATRATRPPRAQPERAQQAASRLTERLDTRVRVEVGRGKGRITVEFGDLEDLERLLSLLDPSGSD